MSSRSAAVLRTVSIKAPRPLAVFERHGGHPLLEQPDAFAQRRFEVLRQRLGDAVARRARLWIGAVHLTNQARHLLARRSPDAVGFGFKLAQQAFSVERQEIGQAAPLLLKGCGARFENLRLAAQLRLGGQQGAIFEFRLKQHVADEIGGSGAQRDIENAALFLRQGAGECPFQSRQTRRLQRLRVAVELGAQPPTGGDEKNAVGRRDPVFLQHGLQETRRRGLLGFVEKIGLVEHEQQAWDQRADFSEIGDLDLGDGRIGGQHEDRGVAFGQRRLGGGGVVAVRGADAGRVDQDDALFKQSGGNFERDAGDAALVVPDCVFRK